MKLQSKCHPGLQPHLRTDEGGLTSIPLVRLLTRFRSSWVIGPSAPVLHRLPFGDLPQFLATGSSSAGKYQHGSWFSSEQGNRKTALELDNRNQSVFNPTLKWHSISFCHILSIRMKSLGSVHIQGTENYTRKCISGEIIKAYQKLARYKITK